MRRVIDAIDRQGWSWYLTGSEALAAYGAPRQTLDTDIVVDTDGSGLSGLGAAIGDGHLFAEPIQTAGRWLASVIDRATIGKVDLIARDPDAWGASAMARRRSWAHPVWGRVWVSTLEDLVLANLEWSDGTSELQLRDCASLLRMNRGRVDMAYLERWARALEVTEWLARVRDAS